jgi:hypothetical protein
MNKNFCQLLFSVCAILISSSVFSQLSQRVSAEFLYSRKDVNRAAVYSLDGPYKVEFPKPKKTYPNMYERPITTTEGNYNFVFNKKEKKCTLLSADGQTLGTFVINGKNKFDITMNDGTIYDWVEGLSIRQWKYRVNGKDAFVCTFVKKKGKKYLQYDLREDQSANLTTAITISHIYGADLIEMKASQPALFFLGFCIGFAVTSAL